MPLSWNEIKHRAIAFSKEWQDETREDAEAKSFWDAFFLVFGVPRRTVASFEEPVKKLSGDWGFIDLFWPKTLLAEHKSAGKDLGKAHAQGMEYIRGLVDSGRGKEVPRYLIVSDFKRIAIHDLEPEQDPDAPLFQRLPSSFEFPLADFHKHIRHFFFIAGYKQHRLNPEDPANEEATRLMCDLHDALEAGEYGTDVTGRAGHDLKQFLVRLLFCLFAEDNGIFLTKSFQFYLEDHTAADGSDLGPKLHELFEVLNTPEDRRQKHLDPDLAQFPYINGLLFAERLALPAFTSAMRAKLFACCGFEWDAISPAVFGSLFQAVMDAKERRRIGAHYTAEGNILKVVRSLFLDDLRAEFTRAKKLKIGKRERLIALQKKIAALRFLDPACGCGNFLVITYRELRALELEILLELHAGQQQMGEAEVFNLSLINVDQMFGIEIEEFPARIAEVALWLTDHQANMALSVAFTQFYCRIPLRSSPHIHVANALRKDWKEVLPPAQCSYVLGNPPFVGKKEQGAEQKADMDAVWGEVKGAGILDFVTAWYRLAAEYIQNTPARVGFVSTNSISQGEQVSILWGYLLSRYRVKIQFAHRTFPWESEARGKAHVHVVIIGFGLGDVPEKRLYDYDHNPANPVVAVVSNISPYLIQGSDTIVKGRTQPLCSVPEISYGSMMIDKDRQDGDDAGLILSPEHRQALLGECPALAPFIRRLYGGNEFLNGIERYCLWLVDAPPTLVRNSPMLRARIATVRKFRESSGREQTKRLAATPTLFGEIRQPSTAYLFIPKVSSMSRHYIPIGFVQPDIIASGSSLIVPSAEMFHFGVLSSAMHNSWMRCVAGRMKSDFQYSNAIVYNNYPWPATPTAGQRAAVEEAAQRVLDARAGFPGATLADLYDPLATPPALAAAHAALDQAVDKCYRDTPFASDRSRVEYLFQLYETLTAPLAPAAKPKRARRAKGAYAKPPPGPAQPGITPEKAYADAAHFYGKEESPPYEIK